MAARASSSCCSTEAGCALRREPMFCFETAMNMLYWSALVYDYEEVRGGFLLSRFSPCLPYGSSS